MIIIRKGSFMSRNRRYAYFADRGIKRVKNIRWTIDLKQAHKWEEWDRAEQWAKGLMMEDDHYGDVRIVSLKFEQNIIEDIIKADI